MSPHQTTQRDVSFLLLPGAELIRADEGSTLRVTIVQVPKSQEPDGLLRDVGRPTWPHRADQ